MHGFEGWLLKVNGVEFPNKYIHAGSYKCTPDQETDLDDYTATKIEFDIKPVRLADMAVIKSILPADRQKMTVEYWNDWTMSYCTGEMYMPDIEFEPYMVYRERNDILYNPTRVAFIEYGAAR